MAKKPKSKRVVFRIMVSPSAKAKLEQINRDLGITHIAMASRLINWFAAQPDEIKAGIFEGFGDLVKTDPAVRLLEMMADGKPANQSN